MEPVVMIGWEDDGELGFAIAPGNSVPAATLMVGEIHRRMLGMLNFKKKSNIIAATAVPQMPPAPNGRG